MSKTIKLSALLLIMVLLGGGCRSLTSETQLTPAPATPNTSEPVSAPPANPPTTTPTTPTTQPAPTPEQSLSALPTIPPPPAPAIQEGINIGNLALDFQLQTLTGENVTLSGLRGKPVLVNFWATWCGPCKAEMPYLQQIHDSWSAKGLVLLAVDIGEKPATIEKFMTELNLSLTVLMDTDMKVAKAYVITAIPTTFLIDKDGVIRQKVLGAFPSKEAIENQLSTIMP